MCSNDGSRTLLFRGRVKLPSLKAEDLPLVYANYFSHPDDYKPFVEAVKFNKAFAAAFVKYNATMFDVADPVCNKYKQGKRISDFIHHRTFTDYIENFELITQKEYLTNKHSLKTLYKVIKLL